MPASANQIVIYTDGSCLKNPEGPGGWSVVLHDPSSSGLHIEAAGASDSTTNNRMEMMAALQALALIRAEYHHDMLDTITIHTDSEYVLKGMTKWCADWIRNGWRTADGKPVKNRDLWVQLQEAARGLRIEWRWVRGHSGIALNERADTLARTAAHTQQGFYSKAQGALAKAVAAETQEKKRSVVIEIDLNQIDSVIAEQVRQAILAARGKSVRFRQAQR